jgi:hypothetical protein
MATPSTTISDIRAQLIQVAQQIQGIGPCYPVPPEGFIEDGGVLFPCKSWQVESLTNGRVRMRLTFDILQLFADRDYAEAVPTLETFALAWWQVLGAWANQRLGGLALSLDLVNGGVSTVTHGETTYLALTHTVNVLTEFLISTS